jgi:predicted thioesterase
MGSYILINHQYQTRYEQTNESLPEGIFNLNNRRVFTAGMNVQLQKPIPIPAVVQVTVDLNRIERRKIFLDVKVKGKDGVQHASCDGLWLSLPLEAV